MRAAVIPVAVLSLLVGLTGTAWASSLVVGGTSIGAGGAAVGRCDNDGATFSFEVEASGGTYVVRRVIVSGISASCDGGLGDLTLTSSSGQPLSNLVDAAVTVGVGQSASFTLTVKPPAAEVKAAYLSVTR